MDWMKTGLKDDTVHKVKVSVDTESKLEVQKRSVINLKKENDFDMFNHKARVAIAIDYSSSMDKLYFKRTVQKVLERLLPLGLQLDCGGDIDVWIFHDDFYRIEPLTLDNLENYVALEIEGDYSYGGTDYRPVLKDLYRKYFREEIDSTPVFVMFITDGITTNKNKIEHYIKKKSSKNLFINFVGLGKARMDYLEHLGKYDNTAFFRVRKINKMSDEELYECLFTKYIDWVQTRNG